MLLLVSRKIICPNFTGKELESCSISLLYELLLCLFKYKEIPW